MADSWQHPDSGARTGSESPNGSAPDLCIVVPAYNEGRNVEPLYEEVSAQLEASDLAFAFLFVDDGSTDDTPTVLARLRQHDPRVRYIRLARNFGLQAALTAGLAHAPGRAVVVMDCDLQDDPAALPRLLDAWREGADIAYAIRVRRRENIFKRAAFRGFHWLMSHLAEIPIPRDAGSFAIYDRRVVDHINRMPETNRYLPGLRAWVGFQQVGVPVARRARHAGQPAQSLGRLISLAADGILAFSKTPLRLATLLGFAVTGVAAIGLLVVIYWRFIARSFPAGVGQATIALALLFLGGVQLLVVGLIGEYLGRVYDEVKRRPHYVGMESHMAAPDQTDDE
jgi:glycosyltransferase involved in cell wall biosynthesis